VNWRAVLEYMKHVPAKCTCCGATFSFSAHENHSTRSTTIVLKHPPMVRVPDASPPSHMDLLDAPFREVVRNPIQTFDTFHVSRAILDFDLAHAIDSAAMVGVTIEQLIKLASEDCSVRAYGPRHHVDDEDEDTAQVTCKPIAAAEPPVALKDQPARKLLL